MKSLPPCGQVSTFLFALSAKLTSLAPNYCYRCGNTASVLKFDANLGRQVVEFEAVPNTTETMPERIITPYFL